MPLKQNQARARLRRLFEGMYKLKVWSMPLKQENARDETYPNILALREDT